MSEFSNNDFGKAYEYLVSLDGINTSNTERGLRISHEYTHPDNNPFVRVVVEDASAEVTFLLTPLMA